MQLFELQPVTVWQGQSGQARSIKSDLAQFRS